MESRRHGSRPHRRLNEAGICGERSSCRPSRNRTIARNGRSSFRGFGDSVGRQLKWSAKTLPTGIHPERPAMLRTILRVKVQPLALPPWRTSVQRVHEQACKAVRKVRPVRQPLWWRLQSSDAVSGTACLLRKAVDGSGTQRRRKQPAHIRGCKVTVHPCPLGKLVHPHPIAGGEPSEPAVAESKFATFVTVNLELLRESALSVTQPVDIARSLLHLRRHEQSRPPRLLGKTIWNCPSTPGAALRIAKQTWGDKLRLRRVPLLRGRKMLICRVIP